MVIRGMGAIAYPMGYETKSAGNVEAFSLEKVNGAKERSETEQTAAFKEEFYHELSKITHHRTGSNMAVNEKEAETRTDIMVKPDGSRVLVVTMYVGGRETTMSLEISKPTDMQNDNAGKESDNGELPFSELDTRSDEFSSTVSEAE